MAASNATPLIGLDAVVIDTETTGLDPRKAWIVEFAAARLDGGRLDTDTIYRSLVRPGKPIPKQATGIHGIDDAAVAAAPPFAQIWPELSAQISDALVIGHSVGFDLAVLKRECERAGLAWTPPRTLDVRLLAEIAAPDLAGYSLDNLAAWLEVEAGARHSAVGDALTAARIFQALLPKLRARGIRTLAEAERACGTLTKALDQQSRAGWVEAAAPRGAADADAVMRVDSYPHRHRVRDVMSAPAKVIAPDVPLSDLLKRMAEERVSSFFVGSAQDGHRPETTGIVTERDVMRALAKSGAGALQTSVGEIASRPLAVVAADAFAFLAIARMNRLRVRHLGVIDDTRTIVVALSARDLLRLRAEGSIALGDEIAAAGDVHALGAAWAHLPQVARGLLAEGLSGLEIAALVSHQLAALTERAAALAEERLQAQGLGAPPCPYVFAVLGSAGRGESLLAMDQDNALIFADSDRAAEHDGWFGALGTHVADILHEVGVPYCKGGVMAKNAQWRGSVSTWRRRIAEWVRRSKPEDILAVDIFFDMRGVHGETALADQLWREAFDAAKGQTAFAKLLVDSAGPGTPAFSLLGGFKTENGRIDLKRSGLFGLVSAARALAVCHHLVERSTPARLAGLKALGIGGGQDLDALAEAQGTFFDLMVAQQVADMERGIPPSNAVEVKMLSARDRDRLRAALKATSHVDQLARDLLFKA